MIIADYAFPDSARLREMTTDFLNNMEKYAMPDSVVSEHRSTALKRVRAERGDSWGTRAKSSKDNSNGQEL